MKKAEGFLKLCGQCPGRSFLHFLSALVFFLVMQYVKVDHNHGGIAMVISELFWVVSSIIALAFVFLAGTLSLLSKNKILWMLLGLEIAMIIVYSVVPLVFFNALTAACGVYGLASLVLCFLGLVQLGKNNADVSV